MKLKSRNCSLYLEPGPWKAALSWESDVEKYLTTNTEDNIKACVNLGRRRKKEVSNGSLYPWVCPGTNLRLKYILTYMIQEINKNLSGTRQVICPGCLEAKHLWDISQPEPHKIPTDKILLNMSSQSKSTNTWGTKQTKASTNRIRLLKTYDNTTAD